MASRRSIHPCLIREGRTYTDSIGAHVRRVESLHHPYVTYSRPGKYGEYTTRLSTFAKWACEDITDADDDKPGPDLGPRLHGGGA